MALLTERPWSQFVILPQVLLAAVWHLKDHCWVVCKPVLCLLFFQNRGGTQQYVNFRICGAGTAEWWFSVGEHLQQCSARPLPQLSSPDSQAVHMSDTMGLCCSSWLHESCTFSGIQNKEAGEKAARIPLGNTNEEYLSYL